MRSSGTAVLRGASAATSRRCTQCRPFSGANSGNSLAAAAAVRFTTASRPTSTTSLRDITPITTQRRPLSQQSPQPLRRADTSEQPAAASSNTTAASSAPPETTPKTTFYDLFPSTLPLGPPPAGHFPIDTRALRREFLRLQARAHPDMHPPGPAKARAEALSARINEAYRTLANPLLRAQYLLALRGVDVANDERLKVDDQPELLMVVLEAREEIEDAAGEDDIAGIRTANEERIADGEEALERAFREDDVDRAKREAVRMRYWVNIRESLDNWEPGKPIVLEH